MKTTIFAYDNILNFICYSVHFIDVKIEIAEDDWSYLNKYSEINKITMTTCVAGVANKRLCVQGTEVTQ